MGSTEVVNPNAEFRKLEISHLNYLAQILDEKDCWKRLMAIVRMPDCNESKFNSEDISVIESGAKRIIKSPAAIFLREWGSIGRKNERPTVQTLLNYLIEMGQFKAADYIAVEVLKGEPPKRPAEGPAHSFDPDKMLEEILRERSQQDNTHDENEEASGYSESYYAYKEDSGRPTAPKMTEVIDFYVAGSSERSCRGTNQSSEVSVDMIQFSSDTLTTASSIDSQAVSDSVGQVNYTHEFVNLSSSQLPVCIAEREVSKNLIQFSSVALSSASSSVVESECNVSAEQKQYNHEFVELKSSELPASIAELALNQVDDGEKEENKSDFSPMTSQELPVFVVEFNHHGK